MSTHCSGRGTRAGTNGWQRRRLEGASVEALAEELAADGLDAVEIDRLLDRNAPVLAPPPLGGEAMASPQLLLGMVLVVAGLGALASGRFPWLVLFALRSGVSRIATA